MERVEGIRCAQPQRLVLLASALFLFSALTRTACGRALSYGAGETHGTVHARFPLPSTPVFLFFAIRTEVKFRITRADAIGHSMNVTLKLIAPSSRSSKVDGIGSSVRIVGNERILHVRSDADAIHVRNVLKLVGRGRGTSESRSSDWTNTTLRVKVLFGHLSLENRTLLNVDTSTLENITSFEGVIP
jgi:hypothetical protein